MIFKTVLDSVLDYKLITKSLNSRISFFVFVLLPPANVMKTFRNSNLPGIKAKEPDRHCTFGIKSIKSLKRNLLTAAVKTRNESLFS